MTDANATMQLRAKEAMTRNVLSVRPDWPVEELADFLTRHGIHGAPVTSEAGDLLGVVSLTDIARAATLSEEDLAAADRHEYYQRLLEEPYPADPAVVGEQTERRQEAGDREPAGDEPDRARTPGGHGQQRDRPRQGQPDQEREQWEASRHRVRLYPFSLADGRSTPLTTTAPAP